MDWTGTIEKDGEVIYHMEGTMPDLPGPVDSLTRMAHAATEAEETTGTPARVSITVQHSLPYGELKVSYTVSISVPQEKRWMDYAAEHILAQTVNYVNSGMAAIAPGVPLLPQPIPRTP